MHPPAKKDKTAAEWPSDEDLMVAARHSRETFECLIRRHQQALMNFFGRMGDHNSADDLVQETFVRLFKYKERYRPDAKFTTFLYTLARRAWIDHRRSAGRRNEAHAAFADEIDVRLDAGTGSEKEAHHRVREALAELSEEMRSCVVMSVYQGFKYEEIARIMGIPLGTVKTRVYHAMRKLREVLQ